jgi:DNA polymerase-3 subunit chi
MTKIDFHSNIADKTNYVCRLVRKARAANCKIVIFDLNQEYLKELDKSIWTFSKTDFLPHVFSNDPLASATPIILCHDENEALPHFDVLINLHQHVPDMFSRFKRVIEIVASDESEAKAGRQRYRHYQQLGITPNHTIAKSS